MFSILVLDFYVLNVFKLTTCFQVYFILVPDCYPSLRDPAGRYRLLEIPALSMAVLPKPPFEPVSAKLTCLAFCFYLDIGYSVLVIGY